MPIRSILSKVLLAMSLFGAVGCGGDVATLVYVGVEPIQPKIGDVATVTFKLTDYRGVALAGVGVSFRLDADKPGVVLSPLSASSIKGSGEATTEVVVSNRVTSVIVIAKAGDKEVRSPPISFAGAFASGRQLTFQCGQLSGNASGGRHAIGAYDQSRNLIAGVKLQCTAHVADRNGDGLPGASVSFMTEAGAIGPSESTVADVIGNATVLHKTSYPLPEETTPGVFSWTPVGRGICVPGELDGPECIHTGEYLVPLWMEPYTWTSNPIGTIGSPPNPAFNMNNLQEPRRPDPFRKKPDATFYNNNPRDNLVTMIAVTSGEEGFTDSDNDGKFTAGEAFDDLTEPFVDSNDDGTWQPEEKFIDTNGNLKWDGKNGVWDGNTLIWASERILWTGIPADEDFRSSFPIFRGVQAVSGAPIVVGCESGVLASFFMSDPWFNSLAQNGVSDGCTSNGGKAVKVTGSSIGGVFTYPPLRETDVFIEDALDRMPVAMTNPTTPGCFPFLPNKTFTAVMNCQYTASPIEGHIVFINIPFGGEIVENKR